MAKNEIKVTKESTKPTKNHYHNPTEAWWGKVVVWLLLLGMVGAIIIGFIVAITSGNA
ncbi:MAG: hypothetical protein WCZ00_06075 [Acholeplasmataceae bacterium]